MEKIKYYLPLNNILVDVEKLKQEIFNIVNPSVAEGNYCLTCTEEEQNLENFNFRKYSGESKYDPEKKSRIHKLTGKYDFEIIYWPKILQSSYIKSIGQLLTEYLKFENQPRCRMSLTQKETASSLGMHYDPGTPYRVHIALLTEPSTLWLFKDVEKQSIVELHQPANGVPVLINTGGIYHDIKVLAGSRLHLWYQWTENINETTLAGIT